MNSRLRMPAIAVLLLLAMSGCGPIVDGQKSDPNPDAMIEEGKEFLANGEASSAHRIFHEVLLLRPESTQARWGIVLADLQRLAYLVDETLQYLGDEYGNHSDQATGDFQPMGGVGDTLIKYVEGIFEPISAELLEQSVHLWGQPDSTFEIESLPIRFGGQTAFDLGGQWDHADAAFLVSASHLLHGLLSGVYSVDLNFYLGHVFALPVDFSDLGNIDLTVIWRDLVHLAVEVLSDPDYPNFLGPTASAPQTLPRAGMELGLFCKMFIETGVLITRETDNQENDVIAYVDANQNGVFDGGDTFRFPYFGTLTIDQQALLGPVALLLAGLQDSLLDGSAIDPWPEVATPFDLAIANPLLMELLNLDFGLLPHTQVDLGNMFLDIQYDPTEFKQKLVAFLLCVDANEGLSEMIQCWIENASADSI